MNRVADAADCDWRSVRRFLAGKPMKARTKARVTAALKKHIQRKPGK